MSKSRDPIVSVIIPCYNAERYISLSIESILNQTFNEFELIVVNDASTDGTDRELLKFNDARIKIYNHSKNQGNYAARNLGMRNAIGKYICVMDADDIADENRISVQVKYLKTHENVGCLGSRCNLIDTNGSVIGHIKSPIVSSDELATYLLVDNFMVHPTLMFNRDVLTKYCLFYDERYIYASDFDLINRIASRFDIVNIEEILLSYRIHEQQISSEKRIEQNRFADEIRVLQLSKFNVRFTDEQKKIYLNLIKYPHLLSDSELELSVRLINRLLIKNRTYKIFNQDYLYQLFQFHLNKAQYRMGDQF